MALSTAAWMVHDTRLMLCVLLAIASIIVLISATKLPPFLSILIGTFIAGVGAGQLQALGAQRVLALNTVGGITDAYGPRVLACPDQLIDYTWGRISTLSEEPGSEVLHVDFGHPYTTLLRSKVLAAAKVTGVRVHDGGCYGATQGPRLETNAEIARMRRDGCDLVGMTGMPEASLARELGLDYACLAIVANWAAGCGDGDEITMAEVLANVDAASAGLPELIGELARG